MLPYISAMVFCVIMSGYFSATETAFSSLNKTRIKVLAENGNKNAKLVLKLGEDYNKLISTILIGNNIVNIAVASIGTLVFIKLLGNELGTTTSTIVVTIAVLIFGEITPKSLAKDYPEKFALFSAPILYPILIFFTPLNFIFSEWKKLISKLFHSNEDSKMSQEELLLLFDEIKNEGAIDEDEEELLKNVVEFKDVEVQDILTHRVDLDGVDINLSKEEIAEEFDRTNFSRLIVYENTFDNILGIIHLKDFYKGGEITKKDIRDIMTPPLFVHQTEKIDDLLKELMDKKSHIAIVIDEFGGTFGIVTMEDIFEELVGEIWDEHDVVEEPIVKINDNTYIIDGTLDLKDFCDEFSIKIDSDCLSVSGWAMTVLDCIPKVKDSFTYENLEIIIEKATDLRIEAIKVILK